MSTPTEIEITACVRAMVRSETWSSFWSEEDARKLVKAVLEESRKPRTDPDPKAPWRCVNCGSDILGDKKDVENG